MKIQDLSLKNFTAFDEADFNFCPGINIFIGANSTGKSHVLKIIYTLLKICETSRREQIDDHQKMESLAKDKLIGVFKPDNLGRLVRQLDNRQRLLRRGQNQKTGLVDLTYEGIKFDLTVTTKNEVRNRNLISCAFGLGMSFREASATRNLRVVGLAGAESLEILRFAQNDLAQVN